MGWTINIIWLVFLSEGSTYGVDAGGCPGRTEGWGDVAVSQGYNKPPEARKRGRKSPSRLQRSRAL